VSRTPIFVITLEHRTDRQQSARISLNQAGVDFRFIVSRKSEEQGKSTAMKMATQVEIAIWGSHVKALRALLGTDSQWGLILEDDFVLTEPGLAFLKNQNKINSILESISSHYSIMQIGFLENSKGSRRTIVFAKIFHLVFRFNRFDFRGYINNLRYLGFQKRNELDRNLAENGLEKAKLLFGHRLGTHAYFIDRDAAKLLIDFYERRESIPNFMVNDQFILNLTRNFARNPILKAVRLSKNLVTQSLSPSDNVNRTSTQALKFNRNAEHI
jgi:hypothetical protein